MPHRNPTERKLVRLSEDDDRNVPQDESEGRAIKLGGSNLLDLGGLTEEQAQELTKLHGESMIDVNKRREEVRTDVAALNHTLETISHHTADVASEGQAVTVTHTQDTSIGRTEVIVGNTDTAGRGRLTRSQTGQIDPTYIWAGVVVFGLVVSAIVLASLGG